MKPGLLPACLLAMLLTTGCISGGGFDQRARDLGKAAAEGAIEAVKPKLEEVASNAADKLSASIQAKVDAANAKKPEERNPQDWFWYIAGAMGLAGAANNSLRGVVRKALGGSDAKKG